MAEIYLPAHHHHHHYYHQASYLAPLCSRPLSLPASACHWLCHWLAQSLPAARCWLCRISYCCCCCCCCCCRSRRKRKDGRSGGTAISKGVPVFRRGQATVVRSSNNTAQGGSKRKVYVQQGDTKGTQYARCSKARKVQQYERYNRTQKHSLLRAHQRHARNVVAAWPV